VCQIHLARLTVLRNAKTLDMLQWLSPNIHEFIITGFYQNPGEHQPQCTQTGEQQVPISQVSMLSLRAWILFHGSEGSLPHLNGHFYHMELLSCVCVITKRRQQARFIYIYIKGFFCHFKQRSFLQCTSKFIIQNHSSIQHCTMYSMVGT